MRNDIHNFPIDNSEYGIIIIDDNTTILSVNERFTELTGYDTLQLTGKSFNFFKSAEDETSYTKMWDIVTKQGMWEEKVSIKRSDGKSTNFKMGLHAIGKYGEALQKFVAMFSAIEEPKVIEEDLHRLAYYDTLTKLPNRTLFFDRLHHAVLLANRNKQMIGLLYFDLDDFKAVNDSFGHDFGDQLLCEVAKRVSNVIRDTDTLARLGGDEFIVLTEQVTSSEDAVELANRILSIVSEPIMVEQQILYTSTSVGICLYPQHGNSAKELLKNADHAMYKAKESGKSQFKLFKEKADPHKKESINLLNDLAHALEYKEFFLLYQPQYDIATQTYKGAEILMRWQHPKFGLISPEVFIPLSEMNGLINPITERILIEASENFKILDEHGFNDFSLSVNISPRTLSGGDFISNISFFLDNYYLPSGRINMEITENTFMKNISDLVTKLDYLRGRGVEVEIDDYGTGFTSLNYLVNLPVDTLKIDRSFITGIDKSQKDRAILEALISMAHNLDLKVIAEGAEEQSEVEVLEALQCDIVQGYYFSRPIPFDELLEQLHIGKIQRRGL